MIFQPRHYAQALLELCTKKTHTHIDVCVGEFLAMLRCRGRGRMAWLVLDALRSIAANKGNGERITVTIPHELEKVEREALDTELRGAFGKGSSVAFISDERLLGGMRLTVGDMVYDDSIATRLAALKKQLLSTAKPV